MVVKPLKEQLGFAPELRRYLADLESGVSLDLVIVVTPATLGSSATTINLGSFKRTVTAQLQNAAGQRHEWYSGLLSVAVAESTFGNGTSAVLAGATTFPLVNGIGTVEIDYSATWALNDTQTTTISGTVLGKSLVSHTSVDTNIA